MNLIWGLSVFAYFVGLLWAAMGFRAGAEDADRYDWAAFCKLWFFAAFWPLSLIYSGFYSLGVRTGPRP